MSCSIFPGRLVHELQWDCDWIKDCKWIEDCSVIGFVCLFKRSEAMVNVVRIMALRWLSWFGYGLLVLWNDMDWVDDCARARSQWDPEC